MRRLLSICAVAMLAFGAVTIASADAPAFSARSLSAYRLPGTASMTGTLEVAVAGSGSPTVAAHARVIAIPDSNYTRWWFQKSAADLAAQTGAFADPADDRKLQPFERTTFTDQDGNFRFDGLPAGAYRVRGRVVATFDRTVESPHTSNVTGLDGSPNVTTEETTTTLHDHSAFWLESGLVRLRPGDSRAISLHVAVRRNTIGRR